MHTTPRFRTLVAIAALSLSTMFASANDFSVDKAHSGVNFTVSHLSISKVRGRFSDFTATWSLDDKGKLSALNVIVKIQSIDTDNNDRDDHLRNPDFFEVEKFPEMTFTMAKYVETSPGKGKVIGQLTIRDKTMPIELQAEVSKTVDNPWKEGKKKHGIALTGTIDRLQFGVGPKYGDAKIGQNVAITVDLEGDN